MRVILLVAYCNLIFFNLSAQQDSGRVRHRKVELESSIAFGGDASFLNFGIGYGTERHAVYIAVVPPYRTEYNVNTSGIMVGYKFFPNLRFKRANLYFAYNFLYLDKERSVSKKEFSITNAIGHGFELRLFEELYLFSEFGIGIYNYYGRYGNYEYKSPVHISTIFKLGLKKRFRRK